MEQLLHEIGDCLKGKICFIGFDAFIDIITKPVNKKDKNGEEYFETMAQFSEFLNSNGGMSKSIELHEKIRKIGGNNPIMTEAMSRLGIEVHSIGAYGETEIDTMFSELAKRARLYPIAVPGVCLSYEFDQNKLMTFLGISDTKIRFKHLVETVGQQALGRLLTEADLFVLVNFGEMPSVVDIWKGIADYLRMEKPKERTIFFDMSDLSSVETDSINEAFVCMRRFCDFGKTYLSVNENEFFFLYGCFVSVTGKSEPEDLERLRRAVKCESGADDIHKYTTAVCRVIGVDYIILRTTDYFFASGRAQDFWMTKNFFVENPVILTGAGDNQNAGICAGLLCGMDMEDVLKLGVCSGYHYITTGSSCNLESIK